MSSSIIKSSFGVLQMKLLAHKINTDIYPIAIRSSFLFDFRKHIYHSAVLAIKKLCFEHINLNFLFHLPISRQVY